MNSYVHNSKETNKLNFSDVGGKGYNLVELSTIEGILVPESFCVTTEAFKKVFINNNELNSLLDQLSDLYAKDRDKINTISYQIRGVIEGVKIPQDITKEITTHLKKFSYDTAYAGVLGDMKSSFI